MVVDHSLLLTLPSSPLLSSPPPSLQVAQRQSAVAEKEAELLRSRESNQAALAEKETTVASLEKKVQLCQRCTSLCHASISALGLVCGTDTRE